MAKYDLTGSLETSFNFSIGDKEYTFRKPTVREMRELAKKFSAVDASAGSDQQLEASETAMNELYGFITPINTDVQIADIMDDQPIGVQVAFNEMVRKELGA